MSQIKLAPNASGTGIFTIDSPNSNTNRTLTLPDNTGTILTSATTTGFPAGSVLQVVNTLKTSLASIASTTFADISGLSATITPKSASNKILILVSINGITIEATVTALRTRILRDSTTLEYIDSSIGYSSLSQLYAGGVSIGYYDSPATTSSITYKIQFATSNGNQAYINNYTNNNSSSTITLMEIAA
jgi:hypothetical protein